MGKMNYTTTTNGAKQYTTSNDECVDLPSFDGVLITGNETLEISNELSIESFEEGKFPRKLFRAVLKKK